MSEPSAHAWGSGVVIGNGEPFNGRSARTNGGDAIKAAAHATVAEPDDNPASLDSTWFVLDEAGPCMFCGEPNINRVAYQRDDFWVEWDCGVCDRLNEFRMEVVADE